MDDAPKSAEAVISVSRLTKSYGSVRAVDLSFEVAAGRVTRFLGPNGAGKTPTIRMILGLARPASGEARVAGRRYADLVAPARIVGTILDGAGVAPGRTARDHLRILAAARGVDASRVERSLALVDLGECRPASGRILSLRRGRFSLC